MPDFPKEQILNAYNSAPRVVREVFNSPHTTETIESIQGRYALHIDTVDLLGREVGYMLLGLRSPMEFFGRLVAMGIEQAVAKQIVDDVNREIFMPLHDKMQKGGLAQPPAPTPAPTPLTPVIEHVVPTVQEPTPHLEPPVMRAVPPPPSQSGVPLGEAHARTMAEDMALVKAGIYVETQHKEAERVEASITSQTPAAAPVRPPVSAFPPPPAPISSPTPRPQSVETRPAPSAKPVIKSYGIDPYREPID
jgi:hypothetical protein